MTGWIGDAVLWVLASPVLLVVHLARAVRHGARARRAAARAITCRTCGEEIVLVGFWRCRCGFTYRGHLLRVCPVCEAFPRLVRCFRCGATERV